MDVSETAEVPPIQIGNMAVTVIVSDPRWPEPTALAAIVRSALRVTFRLAAARLPQAAGDVSVVFADDEAVRRLNADYRGIDRPTNVLSFPALADGPDPEGVISLGDVILSYGVVLREAADNCIPLDHHVGHLVVHGVLHLLGFDHLDDADAAIMENLETRILDSLDIPNPYDRDRAGDMDDGGRYAQ